MTDRYEALQELDDYKLVNRDQDLRGQGLYTDNGIRLGTVSRMLVARTRPRSRACPGRRTRRPGGRNRDP